MLSNVSSPIYPRSTLACNIIIAYVSIVGMRYAVQRSRVTEKGMETQHYC